MNINPLRQSILKESIIFGVVAAVMGVGVYFLSDMHDDFLQQRTTLDAHTKKLVTDKQAIESSFDYVQKNMELHNEAMARTSSPGMFIDRQAVRDIFNIYSSRYYLKKLTLDMQPVVDITSDPKFVSKTLVAMQSEVQISFEAVSDEDVYQMMRALSKELPGFVRIHGLEIKRIGDVDKKAITDIRAQGSAPLVSGTIDFTWYGIKSPDPKSATNKYVITKPERRKRKR